MSVSGLFRHELFVVGGREQPVEFARILQRHLQHPRAMRVEFTFSGAVARSALTSVTVPETGANRSETAFTDSTVPNVLPAVSSAPTLGVSTNTMSPNDCWA